MEEREGGRLVIFQRNGIFQARVYRGERSYLYHSLKTRDQEQARMLELAKGKPAIEVASAKELVAVLGTLRKAAEQGELDAQVEVVGAAVKARLKKK